MNAEELRAVQEVKNQKGKPKYVVTADAGLPENDFMNEWIDKWGDRFDYFDNKGCGGCVNIYEFDAPAEAVAEIPVELLQPYIEPVEANPQSRTSKS